MASPLRPLTQAQLLALVNQYALASQKTQRADLAAKRQRTLEISKALAELQRGIGPATGAAYQSAAQTQGNLAQGFSDQMRGAVQADADAAAASLSRLGAPQGQIDQVSGVGRGAGDVSYALGGAIPGGSLAREGAAFAAAQNQLPSQALAQGQADIRGIAKEESALDAELPKIRAEYQNQLIGQEVNKAELGLRERAQALYEQQFGLDVVKTKAGIQHQTRSDRIAAKKAQRSYEIALKKHNLAVREAAREGRQPNAALSAKYGHIVDADGNAILDKRGKPIPVAKGAGAKDSKTGLSASQLATRRKDAIDDAVEMRGEPMTLSDSPLNATKQGKYIAQPGKSEFKDGSTNQPRNAKHDGEHSFGEAVGIISEKYNVSRTRARSWLIAAGWKPPKKKKRPSMKPNKTRIQ